jgi:hypothetical protein
MTLKKSQKRMKEIGREGSDNARDRLWFQPVSRRLRKARHPCVLGVGCGAVVSQPALRELPGSHRNVWAIRVIEACSKAVASTFHALSNLKLKKSSKLLLDDSNRLIFDRPSGLGFD